LAERYPGRRKVVLFQPHRHTRTKDLFERFVVSFNEADKLLVTDIYGAGEAPFENVTAEALALAIRGHGHKGAEHLPGGADLAQRVFERLAPGDVLMTLGAGNVWQAGEAVLGLLSSGGAGEEGGR
jgi:UDP-N-acetylmuramate--alanine ligase